MKRAFVIGLNSYTKQKSLRGAVNDASLVADLLRYRFAFDHVTTALDRLTKSDFVQGLRDLLEVPPTEVGEPRRVFYFAGHGASVIDNSQDETDFIDEVLCLPTYSWEDPQSFVRDDEIAELLASAKTSCPGLATVCILDCCHSGTGTRDVAIHWPDLIRRHHQELHGLPLSLDDPRLVLYSAIREADSQPTTAGFNKVTTRIGTGNATDQERMTHLLISACSDAQKAKEAEVNGTPHGVFTLALCRAASNSSQLTYGGLHNAITNEMSRQLDQTPQIEGPTNLRHMLLFE